jgi:chromosome condensin MukBEF complex kleisin-like MukF subunit
MMGNILLFVMAIYWTDDLKLQKVDFLEKIITTIQSFTRSISCIGRQSIDLSTAKHI